MRKIVTTSIVAITLSAILISCFQKEPIILTPTDINFDELPYENLSQYGFFVGDISNLIPSEKVLLYKPISTLFSDYSHKSRFVWMPDGASATILDDTWEQIDFPDKSIIIKNFYYPEDFNNPDGEKDIIETRLLIKNDGKWVGYPYKWNEEQNNAKLNIIGGKYEVNFTDKNGKSHTIDYQQPNKTQCKSCHNQNEELLPIGPKARNLNFDIAYSNGETKNQLVKWHEMGYLSNFTSIDSYNSMVDYNDPKADLDLRAKAYLEMNCGHCHNEKGPASTSGLFMTYEVENPFRWGVSKAPVAAGIGAGPHKFDIYPGNADSSIIIYRMNSSKPGIAMPEIGRIMVHQEGVELISEWINAMSEG